MALPRVLLVEDDALLRRFVRMALEELPLELLECDSVPAALQQLAASPVQLILTDLMLPGVSGLDLLRHLQQSPLLRGQAKVVVLSAGLTPEARQQLAPLGAWRLLDKPVSLSLLTQCVEDALAADPYATAPPAPADPALDPALASAIDQYFAGDTELFGLYRASCLLQLPHDIATGNQACRSGDVPALRRVVHSLKTVLLTLGAPHLSAQAHALEQACSSPPTAPATAAWAAFSQALAQWIDLQK
nr:response regulator [uncultured Albidiferax sp.]